MKKVILTQEPICPIGNVLGHKTPHHVTTLHSFDPDTREAKFKCSQDPNQGFSAVLPEGFVIPFGKQVLLQEKVVGTDSILKVKDVADSNIWETGKEYVPSIPESVVVTEHKQFAFNRKVLA